MRVFQVSTEQLPYLAAAAAGTGVALLTVGLAWFRRRLLRRRMSTLALRVADEATTVRSNRIDALLTAAEDGAERIMEEVANLRAGMAALRVALDGVQQAVLVTDDEGAVVFRNRRAAGLEPAGDGGDLLVADAVRQVLAEAGSGANGRTEERTLEIYGPPRRTVRVRAQAVDDGRRPVGVVAVVDDLSAVGDAHRQREELISGAAAELHTPATALEVLADAVATEESPELAAKLAVRLRDEARRVTRTVDELVQLAQAAGVPAGEPVTVAEFLARAVSRVASAAESRTVNIAVSGTDEGLVVLGDRHRLVSAAYHMISNAVRVSPPGERVDVEVGVSSSMVEITVRDQGGGIPEAVSGRVFDPFYRARPGAEGCEGPGLGLAIVHRVAMSMGGSVSIDSRPGEGTVVALRLPVAPAATAA